MKVPKRIIDRISRKLHQELVVYRADLTPAHQPLFGPLVLAMWVLVPSARRSTGPAWFVFGYVSL